MSGNGYHFVSALGKLQAIIFCVRRCINTRDDSVSRSGAPENVSARDRGRSSSGCAEKLLAHSLCCGVVLRRGRSYGERL
jgi:hypothetical protein